MSCSNFCPQLYYVLCSIQHEGLLKVFNDGNYCTVLQERVS